MTRGEKNGKEQTKGKVGTKGECLKYYRGERDARGVRKTNANASFIQNVPVKTDK